MTTGPADLVPLLTPPPDDGVGYRQGVILTWNPLTAENTVDVDGTVLTNLPILNTNEALQLVPGDVVGILTTGGKGASSWAIIGRLTVPGTAAAATALGMFGIRFAKVVASETTTSSSYVDLATPGPAVTVTIGPGRRALILLSVMVQFTIDGNTAETKAGQVSVAITGASTIAAGTIPPAGIGQGLAGTGVTGTLGGATTQAWIVDESNGLNVGVNVFTVKYLSLWSNTVYFADRLLTVIPF